MIFPHTAVLPRYCTRPNTTSLSFHVHSFTAHVPPPHSTQIHPFSPRILFLSFPYQTCCLPYSSFVYNSLLYPLYFTSVSFSLTSLFSSSSPVTLDLPSVFYFVLFTSSLLCHLLPAFTLYTPPFISHSSSTFPLLSLIPALLSLSLWCPLF